MDFAIQITPNAAKRVCKLIAEQSSTWQYLRISVTSGGCYGFQYNFEFTKDLEEDDFIIEKDGAQIIIDPASMEFLHQSIFDYIEDLGGAYFQVRSPQAKGKCGCGSSFSL
jgi:iron-sulfur cluster insertion protein